MRRYPKAALFGLAYGLVIHLLVSTSEGSPSANRLDCQTKQCIQMHYAVGVNRYLAKASHRFGWLWFDRLLMRPVEAYDQKTKMSLLTERVFTLHGLQYFVENLCEWTINPALIAMFILFSHDQLEQRRAEKLLRKPGAAPKTIKASST